jgi:hypothetical protein
VCGIERGIMLIWLRRLLAVIGGKIGDSGEIGSLTSPLLGMIATICKSLVLFCEVAFHGRPFGSAIGITLHMRSQALSFDFQSRTSSLLFPVSRSPPVIKRMLRNAQLARQFLCSSRNCITRPKQPASEKPRNYGRRSKKVPCYFLCHK